MRVFLSHSSADKGYVHYVSEKLSTDEVIIDKHSFQVGTKSNAEMERLVNECDILVFFISKNSLVSQPVMFEIETIKPLLEHGGGKTILPIIIDSTISYRDPLIPEWLRDYNLKVVTKPTKALARIREEIKILTWDKYSFVKELNNIFRGRNEYIEKFENRFSDRHAGNTQIYIASGFEKIGRKAFLTNSFRKVGKIRNSYEFPTIKLSHTDSIEDFIFRMNELGVSIEVDVTNLIEKTVEEKVQLATTILDNYYENNEVVLIYDNGCIILPTGQFSAWFSLILSQSQSCSKPGAKVAIASTYSYSRPPVDGCWTISIPELTPNERKWLLEDYLRLFNISLTDEEFTICHGWLQGYPQQVLFLAGTLNQLGFQETKMISKEIIDYNSKRADSILGRYLDESRKMEFLATLSVLQLTRVNDLMKAFKNDDFYKNLLTELLTNSICTYEGVAKEYIRLSDIVNDYISRKRIPFNQDAATYIKNESTKNFENNEHGIPEASDLYLVMREAIKSGKEPDNRYVFPSHFAKCMRDLYNEKNRDSEVIRIARYLLSKHHTIDENMLYTAHYYLSLTYARNKDRELFQHTIYLNDSDQSFIKGFYYRKLNRHREAIECFRKTLMISPHYKRAKSELAATLNRVGEYEEAYELAKVCYKTETSNIYYAQEYFKCLLYRYLKTREDSTKEEIQQLLIATESNIGNIRDNSMFACMKASFLVEVEGDAEQAYEVLDSYGTSSDIYVILAKFNVADKTHHITRLTKYHKDFTDNIKDRDSYFDIITANEITIMAHEGRFEDCANAIEGLSSQVFSDSFKNQQRERVQTIIRNFFTQLV